MRTKRVILGLLLACTVCTLTAETSKDSLSNDSLSIKVIKRKAYLLQKKHLPYVVKPFGKKLKDRLFIETYGEARDFRVRDNVNYPYSFGGGLSIGYSFTPVSSLRLGGLYTPKQRNSKLELWEGYADYMFNFSNFLSGYSTSRKYEYSGVLGLGVTSATREGESYLSPDIHAGLQIKYHARPYIDLFLEPQVGWYKNALGLNSNTLRNYDIAYVVRGGLAYRFSPIKTNVALVGRDFFVGAMVGVSNEFNDGQHVLGPQFSLNLGQWFYPFGLRLSLFGNERQKDALLSLGMNERMFNVGGRLEGLLNLNTFFNPKNPSPRCELNLLGGLQFGYIGSSKPQWKERICDYIGPTGGIQGVYNFSKTLGLVLEARYESFSYNRTELPNTRWSFDEENIAVEAGLRIKRAGKDVRTKLNTVNLFKPYWFAEASAGLALPLQYPYGGIKKLIKGRYVFGLGRQISSLHALRVSGEFSDYCNNKEVYKAYTAQVDYLYNLTNMMLGYNPNRLVNAQWLVGGSYLKAGKNYIGGQTGLRLDYNVQPQASIFAEGQIKLYSSSFLDGNGIKFLGCSTVPVAAIGARYIFGNNSFKKSVLNQGLGCNTFVSGQAGVVKQRNDNGSYGQQMGISVGKWYYPLGLRATLYSNGSKADSHMKQGAFETHTNIGLRLEGMLNVNTLVSQVKKLPLVEVNLLGGYIAGYNVSVNSRWKQPLSNIHGYSAGGQLVWNVKANTGIFAEARYEHTNFKRQILPTRKEYAFSNDYMALELGVMMRRDNRLYKERLKERMLFNPYFFAEASAGVNVPLCRDARSRGVFRNVGPQGGVAAGYQFTSRSAIRFKTSYVSYKNSEEKFGAAKLQFDYMLNLSNWMLGDNKNRKVDVQVLGGLSGELASEKSIMGGNGALRLDYKATDKYGVFIEGGATVYGRNFLEKNAFRLLGGTAVTELNAGLRYSF